MYLYGTVADTGPGMTAAEKASLFQRFSQASAKTHTVFGGSGLGLFVCRKITRRMDGDIDVVSEPGAGSKFQFYVAARTPPSTSEPAPASPPLPGALDARVLVVEDNIINRTVVLRQMKQAGVRAEAVTNGLEALERLRETQKPGGDKFDCVLMDLEMPVMDGYTATKRLRAEEKEGRLERSRVVALTGNARQALIQEQMRDFDDVAVKPYRLDALLGKIAVATRPNGERSEESKEA